LNISDVLEALLSGQDLTTDQVEAVFDAMLRGELTDAQIAGLLIALRAKGEVVHEIAAAARVMRRHATGIAVDPSLDPVDTCGTGGDRSGTFNLSTAAALVAAGAGACVAKHGNRSVSSQSGSADVLEALGVDLSLAPEALGQVLKEVGIAFLFAPVHHAATRHAVGPRKQLGVRTLFNVLGPLTNPAGVRRQVVGVFAPQWVAPLAQVLGELGAVHALVVHGAGGLDEFSLAGPTQVAEWRDGSLRTYAVSPGEVGLPEAPVAALRGGDAQYNAGILRAVFAGETGPRADAVAYGAGAALYVAGHSSDIREGVAKAKLALANGAATATLNALVAATNR
jgi:anthranilate phosphoribosyltransferase